MKPYHPANLRHIDVPAWRVIVFAYIGKWLGIQFHIGGIPFGVARKSASTSLSNGGA